MSSKDNEPNISNIKNSDPNMREDRKLANIIKDTHAKLREQIQAIDNKLCPNKSEIEDNLWIAHADARMFSISTENASSDRSIEVGYSEAMEKLADKHWCDNIGKRKNEIEKSSRIEWLKKHVNSYRFRDRHKFQKRLIKRKYYESIAMNECSIDSYLEVDLNKQEPANENYEILDVGSCYNPLLNQFSSKDVKVTAVDLCPSSKSVFKCDFLRVPIVDIDEAVVIKSKKETVSNADSYQEVECLKENGFDVVIFCLLLEYLPSSRLRYKACQKAKTLLKTDGLLLIVTPDSSRNHAKNERQMKSWRLAFSKMGMLRIYIENQKHLRFLGFVKVDHDKFGNICDEESEKIKDAMSNISDNAKIGDLSQESFSDEDLMFIPQDKTTRELLKKQAQIIKPQNDTTTSDFSKLEHTFLEFSEDFSM